VSARALGRLLIAAAIACTGCTGTAAPPTTGPTPAPQTVTIAPDGTSYAFAPATVHIGVGGRIVWMNPTAVGHSVTFTATFSTLTADGTFNELIGVTGSVDRTFATAGTYLYFCAVHPVMHGTVVVGGG
jgi:plastocyanin